MNIKQSLAVYLFIGLLSGSVCWAGSFWIPEDSLLAKIYPGIVLGLALFVLGHVIGVQPPNRGLLSSLVLIVLSVFGWRLSIDVGFAFGNPLPFTAAGAIGALPVALGLLLAWPAIRRRYFFVALVTLGGTIGGLLFQSIDTHISDSDGTLWVFLLFVEWQVVFLLGIWLAMRFDQPRGNESGRHSAV